MSHTPLPWRVTPCGSGAILIECDDAESERTQMTTCVCDLGSDKQAKDDAELIVKSVNSHDELLEALEFYANAWICETKELISAPEYNHGHARLVGLKHHYYPSDALRHDVGNKARELLAKVKDES